MAQQDPRQPQGDRQQQQRSEIGQQGPAADPLHRGGDRPAAPGGAERSGATDEQREDAARTPNENMVSDTDSTDSGSDDSPRASSGLSGGGASLRQALSASERSGDGSAWRG